MLHLRVPKRVENRLRAHSLDGPATGRVGAVPAFVPDAFCDPRSKFLTGPLAMLRFGPTYPSRALLPTKSESLCVVTPPHGLSPDGRRAGVPRPNDPSHRPRTASFAAGCDHSSVSARPGLPAWGSALSPAPLRCARSPAVRSTTGPIRPGASSSQVPFPDRPRPVARSLGARASAKGVRYAVRMTGGSPSWQVELPAATQR